MNTKKKTILEPPGKYPVRDSLLMQLWQTVALSDDWYKRHESLVDRHNILTQRLSDDTATSEEVREYVTTSNELDRMDQEIATQDEIVAVIQEWFDECTTPLEGGATKLNAKGWEYLQYTETSPKPESTQVN